MRVKVAQFISYIKEPYPYYYRNQKRLFYILLLISILSFCFSYFFEPFVINVAEHKISSFWILVIHAFIPFPIAYVYLNVLNSTITDDSNWTIRKEFFTLSGILLLIGIFDFLIRDFIYANPNNWSIQYLFEEIRNTFLVGMLLLLLVLPLNLERLIKKHSSSLKKLAIGGTKEENNLIIPIKSTVLNEDFELNSKDFLFAKVESNYTEIYTSSPEGNTKMLIRITLKELEEQLKSVSNVFKTHRSYLVHLNAIESISGNAQGYQLILKNCAVTIPVSRSNITSFNAVYAKI